MERRVKLKATYFLTSAISLMCIHNYVYARRLREFSPSVETPHSTERPPLTPTQIANISSEIRRINHDQEIYNSEHFGPAETIRNVIVIQVHSRVDYLRHLVDSLSRVRGVENSLLVFSHDLYLPELNDVVQSIGFSRVLQIFYQESIQLHPNQFPGQAPNDCLPDMTVATAKKINCSSANNSDSYGRFRNPRFTQAKHHWWWKGNFVFGRVKALENYTGVITFLEEDHYVTPDFLWVLNLMNSAMERNQCQGCNLLSLGSGDGWSYDASPSDAVSTKWRHNMGMSLNKTLWEKIKNCSSTFCNYDDYNWDWSLQKVSYTCLKPPLQGLYPTTTRVFHIGDCGLHHKKKVCQPEKQAFKIENDLASYSSYLFPSNLTIVAKNGTDLGLRKGNTGWGGWGDPRDKQLCLRFSDRTTL